MANPLDWLLQSVAPPPSPLKYDDGQPSLTAYYPKPSERFEGWVHSLLGGGSQASLPHENFARGVPKLLEMTPLGIGLSAADLVRAKWDNDPMGAAAAAIGMIPGVGRAAPEIKAGAKIVKDQADIAMEAIMEALHGKAPSIPVTKATANDPTAAALKAIEEILGPTPVHAPGPGTPYLMGGPANPANSPIGVAKQTAIPAAAPKPIYDYEKDDNGLYHIFDATQGKTLHVVDTPNQAKAWIASEEAKAKLPPTSMPIKVASSGETTFENLGAFPKSVPFQPPPQAIEHGYVTPAVHGTKVSADWWKTPESNIIVGGPQDALRLPSEELGVHFGTPDQARQFTGNIVGGGYTPRTYPTVLQTGRSLELPDMGTWHVSRIKEALERLNKGTGYGVSHGRYTVKDPAAHMGLFPQEELEKIDNIQQMRDYLNKKGFNSVNYINTVESPGHTSHIMFNPSPEAPDFVAGVRSPFAAFDPKKAMRPELAYSIGALLGLPALMPREEKQ